MSLTQIEQSIDKLFHYLLVFTKTDVTAKVTKNGIAYFQKDYKAPSSIEISPTLYTRVDDCHGAGNCCRVEFDLAYTVHDYNRVLLWDRQSSLDMFGKDSTDRFEKNREDLLASFEQYNFELFWNNRVIVENKIYVRQNKLLNPLSGKKSCPYLFMAKDRYYCGVHPFKPLHCWFPHMTISHTGKEPRESITIGRRQYGRNHKFGCPVLFTSPIDQASDIVDVNFNYFDKQFKDDIDKLTWASLSVASLGIPESVNFGVGVARELEKSKNSIARNLEQKQYLPITLWEYGSLT